MLKRKRWDNYYYDIAVRVSERSPCLSYKRGAILVRDKVIICEGFNGAARTIPPCGPERLKHDVVLAHRMNDAFNPIYGDSETCPRQRLGFPSGQGLEHCPAVHAEANAIANAARMGICTKDTTMYLNFGTPCKDCLSLLINAGVREVVATELKRYDALSEFIIKMARGILDIRTYEEEEEEDEND